MIIFRMLTGIHEKPLLKEWRRLDSPTLEEMKRTLRLYLAGKRQEQAQRPAARAARSSDKSPSPGPRKARSPSRNRQPIPDAFKGKCVRCGESGHLRAQCPKKWADVSCTSCKRKGHVASVCISSAKRKEGPRPTTPTPRARSTQQPDTEDDTSAEEEEEATALQVRVSRCSGPTKATPSVKLLLRQRGVRYRPVFCTPDTGATRTIVAANVVDRLQLSTTATAAKLYSAKADERMECTRRVAFQARVKGGPTVEIDALVSRDLYDDVLISWHDLIALGVLPSTFPQVRSYAEVVRGASDVTPAALCTEIAAEFTDVLREDFPEGFHAGGEPVKIQFAPGSEVRPRHALTTRPIPLHMRDDADKLLSDLVGRGVLEQLDEHVPTEWLHRGHFVPKPAGRGVRLVTDFSYLNKFIRRPVHPFPSPETMFQTINADSKWFAKLDALHGYFQIPLHPDSQPLTAFLLPQGRFVYKVAPMGLNPSGDWWCCRSDRALVGLPGVTKLVDDLLIQAPDLPTLAERIRATLRRCREHKLVLHSKKFVIGTEVPFAGHVVSSQGVRPDPEKLQAIREFPVPRDLTGLRSFLGLANQLGHYIPDLSQLAEPLRPLLRKNTAWVWTPAHQRTFEKVKAALTAELSTHFFDPSLQSYILTDASRVGLGYLLLQEVPNSSPVRYRTIACGSRSLNPAESRYAPIELECLGVSYALSKCHFYLAGSPRPFTVITDHKPLLGLFDKPLSDVPNARLQRLRLRTVGYSFNLQWQAGKLNVAADALSRAPVFGPVPPCPEDEEEAAAFARAIRADAGLRPLLQAAKSDAYQLVVAALRDGLDPLSLAVDHPALPLRPVWHMLSLRDVGDVALIVYDGCRIVVPPSARSAVVSELHRSHAGIVKTCVLAKQLYYWPNMGKDIEDRVRGCEACQEDRPSKASAPLAEPVVPSRPFEEVALDYFKYGGKFYLVMVDRYSGFPFVHQMTSTTTAATTRRLHKWFCLWGFPDVVRSDGGPQFTAAGFKNFCWARDIEHRLSSPYYPQSNGLAEAAVKNCKRVLKKCIKAGGDYHEAMLAFRNTPRADGHSPAQLLFGRRLRTSLPALPEAYAAPSTAAAFADKASHDVASRRWWRGTRAPAVFSRGDSVRVQDTVTGEWTGRGVVLRAHSDRSYDVEMNGTVTRRNEKHLSRVHSPPSAPAAPPISVSSAPPAPPLRRSERIRERLSPAPAPRKTVRFSVPHVVPSES
jgi:transposase InsO family protein